jgi:hypothetical protein
LKSKRKQESEPEPVEIPKKWLQRNIGSQFGSKAPEKLQRLLFMLRENSDVLEVFVDKILNYIFENRQKEKVDLAEPIVHLMFQDLTAADPNQRVIYIIYQLTVKTFTC